MLKNKNNQKYPNRKKSRKPYLVAAAVLVTLVALAIPAWPYYSKDSRNVQTASSMDMQPPVDYSPPSEEDLREARDAKDAIANQPDASPAPQPSSKPNPDNPSQPVDSNLAATLTRFDKLGGLKVEAAGYVTGVFEDDGLCTYTFTSAGRSLTATSQGVMNASNTICAPAEVTLPAGGAWSATLTYRSKASQNSNQSNALQINL